MKTMKKTCTTFLLAFVMLLACVFPIFSAKGVKKASALSTHDTLYYFSDSFYTILREDEISEEIDSYYIKTFEPAAFMDVINSRDPSNLFSNTQYHDEINVNADTSEFSYNPAIVLEFLVDKPIKNNLLSFLDELIAYDVSIITAHPLEQEIINKVDGYHVVDTVNDFFDGVLGDIDVLANPVYFIDRRLLGLRVDEVTPSNCFAHPFIQELIAKIRTVLGAAEYLTDQQALRDRGIAIFISIEDIAYQALELATGIMDMYLEIEDVLYNLNILAEEIVDFKAISYYHYSPIMSNRVHTLWNEDDHTENGQCCTTLAYLLEVAEFQSTPGGLPSDVRNPIRDDYDILSGLFNL